MFGYVPLGMAFGLLFSGLDYPWYFASLMGIFIFAGAAQFLAIGLLSAQAGLLEIAIATFVLNSRHMFYGLSMLSRFKTNGWRKLYLIFGLTDETYSLLTGTESPDKSKETDYYLLITGLNQFYWVLGCTLGVVLGESLSFDTTGLDFALVALFIVLLIEQAYAVRKVFPFVLAAVAGFSCLWLFDKEHMLLFSILASTTLLLLCRKMPIWKQ